MSANVATTGEPRATRSGQKTARNRVLVVEDDECLREVLGPFLEDEGYQVSVAPNGREALERLAAEAPPDLIILDLRMPVMDGWQFRSIQKDDPKLSLIPVVAISADDTAPATAISAQAYLHKPVDVNQLLATVERVLRENEALRAAREDETQRLASLGRLAAGVGHEINNPLAYVMLNLSQSLALLRPALGPAGDGSGAPISESVPEKLKAVLLDVVDMLEDCRTGSERIRETVDNLQRLSRRVEAFVGQLDVNSVIEQSLSVTWTQIRHRARLVKNFNELPAIRGDRVALGQVFMNLLVNAAQSIPEGDAERNEIRISTKMCGGDRGREIMVELSDTGGGIPPELLVHIFEPFFTTKAMGEGAGLGLSISHQTVLNHGGRLSVESQPGRGTTFRIFLPVGATPAEPTSGGENALPRGRVLVIDDEELVGRAIERSLRKEHDVVVVQRASEAMALFERSETFDLVFCDVTMPDISGPELYATVQRRWPHVADRMVFMTGGAFTPQAVDFVEHCSVPVLTKPCRAGEMSRLVRERMQDRIADEG